MFCLANETGKMKNLTEFMSEICFFRFVMSF